MRCTYLLEVSSVLLLKTGPVLFLLRMVLFRLFRTGPTVSLMLFYSKAIGCLIPSLFACMRFLKLLNSSNPLSVVHLYWLVLAVNLFVLLVLSCTAETIWVVIKTFLSVEHFSSVCMFLQLYKSTMCRIHSFCGFPVCVFQPIFEEALDLWHASHNLADSSCRTDLRLRHHGPDMVGGIYTYHRFGVRLLYLPDFKNKSSALLH